VTRGVLRLASFDFDFVGPPDGTRYYFVVFEKARLSLAKNTSDRSPSDISVLAMEQIGLRGHKVIHARDVTGT